MILRKKHAYLKKFEQNVLAATLLFQTPMQQTIVMKA
jgi:hypothetical protein